MKVNGTAVINNGSDMNKNLYILGGTTLAIMLGVVAVLITTGPTDPNTSQTDLFATKSLEKDRALSRVQLQTESEPTRSETEAELPGRLKVIKGKVEDLTQRLQEERAVLESTADVAGTGRGQEIIAQTNALIKRTNQRLGIDGEEVEQRVVSKASATDPRLLEINSRIEVLRGKLDERRTKSL